MKSCFFAFTCVCLFTGCFGHKSMEANLTTPPSAKNSRDKFILSPEAMLIGKVVQVNSQAQFVVINFPVGKLPSIGQTLTVYRHGLKVGEIKITGPQQEDNIVADIVHGEIQTGDELRGP